MHVVQRVYFWLDVIPIGCVCVEDFGPGRRRIELALLGLVVVVVVLSLVVDLVVYVIDRVGERIQIFLFVFLGHVRIVLFLLEADLNGNPAAVKEGLPVEILDRKQGTLLVLVVHKGPELRLLQPNRLYLPQQGEDFVEGFPAGLARERPHEQFVVVVLAESYSLLLGVQPLDVDRTTSSRNYRVLELLYGLLGIAEGGEFDEGRACEEGVLLDELDV